MQWTCRQVPKKFSRVCEDDWLLSLQASHGMGCTTGSRTSSRSVTWEYHLIPNKIQIDTKVMFASQQFSEECSRPYPDMLKTIWDFPQPTMVSTLSSFLRLSNTFQRWALDYSGSFICLKAPLRNKTPLIWSHECQIEFRTLMLDLHKSVFIKPYYQMLDTFIVCDGFAVNGIRFVL